MLQFNEIELFITIIVITIIFIYYGRWDVWSVDSTEDRRKKNYIWVMCISTLVRCQQPQPYNNDNKHIQQIFFCNVVYVVIEFTRDSGVESKRHFYNRKIKIEAFVSTHLVVAVAIWKTDSQCREKQCYTKKMKKAKIGFFTCFEINLRIQRY